MKSIIITFIASFLMLADLSGQWEIVNDTVLPNIPRWNTVVWNDACFINKETGFIVQRHCFHKGCGGSVQMTNDGGKSWNAVFGNLGVVLNKCKFANDLTGFVTSDYGGFYQTSDGGSTWLKKENGLPFIKDLFFVSEHTGFAASDTSIYKTSNTGESWEKILSCTTCKLNSIFFIDDRTGWGVGESGLIVKLTDKGTSEKIASGTQLPLTKIFFTDSNTGWIAGGYNNVSDGFHPVLLKTVNGGKSWSRIESINWLINDVYFRNNQEGWAVGADSNGKGVLIETLDGGNNWAVQVDSLRVPLKATDFKDGYGWAIGNGLVLKKDFSIITWTKENNEKYISNTILFQNYPNPISSKTIIKYQIPAISNVDLSIYSITGSRVKTLVKERLQAGQYEVEWSAEGMKPGIYFCELKAGKFRKVLKMVLIK